MGYKPDLLSYLIFPISTCDAKKSKHVTFISFCRIKLADFATKNVMEFYQNILFILFYCYRSSSFK